ncbi:MAG: rRNA pseudouridine synthase [Provencibacterium sp.]|nr:rRNA pseudouridine synthase [Provencibacterium sp.]
MEKIRIQKILSENGVLSRRKAEEAIAAGRVTVDGRPCTLGQKADPQRANIALDGKTIELRARPKKVYLMLNKPRGFVTTLSDEMGRRCVADLVADAPAKVYPVGRLDRGSEGLLLFTNDGDFANLLMHPSHHIPKTYRVTVREHASEEKLALLCTGVELEDGKTLPAQVQVEVKEPERMVLRIVLQEGRNRQVRRMCEAVGLTVLRLKRTHIGPLSLGMLEPGHWRLLEPAEVGMLRGAASPSTRPASLQKKPLSPRPEARRSAPAKKFQRQ